MITPEMIEDFMSVDLESVELESLADISAVEFDNRLPNKKRIEYILEKLRNPICFRYGGMGIKLEFDDDAPSVQELLSNFLIRKKIGP